MQIDVEASPDEVWELVGDFEGVGDFFPGIDGVEIEGDVRKIAMMGLEISEQLVERDADGRVIVYSVIGGVPVESHKATVSVVERSGGSTVEWSVEVEPAEMLPIFVDTYRQALEQVRQHVDGG